MFVGRIAKWFVDLSQFDVHFIPRTAIKSQVLIDFVADWTVSKNTTISNLENETWTMAFDVQQPGRRSRIYPNITNQR
jgi:hypothetical protein